MLIHAIISILQPVKTLKKSKTIAIILDLNTPVIPVHNLRKPDGCQAKYCFNQSEYPVDRFKNLDSYGIIPGCLIYMQGFAQELAWNIFIIKASDQGWHIGIGRYFGKTDISVSVIIPADTYRPILLRVGYS